jgi:5-methylcytosine-specific restriction endonuclease McrA
MAQGDGVRRKLPMLPARVGHVAGRAPTMQPGSWRTDKQNAAQRGYDYRWQRAREAYLREHPLCVYCLREIGVAASTVADAILECAARGLAVPYGNVVDHIVAHRGDAALFWDQSNWQTLCAMHHSRDKQREEVSSVVD